MCIPLDFSVFVIGKSVGFPPQEVVDPAVEDNWNRFVEMLSGFEDRFFVVILEEDVEFFGDWSVQRRLWFIKDANSVASVGVLFALFGHFSHGVDGNFLVPICVKVVLRLPNFGTTGNTSAVDFTIL